MKPDNNNTNKRLRLSSSDKISFISNLSTMLSAGIPILDAVNNLLEDSKGNIKKVMETLRDDLTQGHQVNYTFAKFPLVFDRVTVNVLKASEEAGTLEVTLKDIRDNLRKQEEFKDKIRSALMYPAFIIGVFFLVLLVNLIFVVPKVALVFKSLRVALPLPTQILITISDFMTKNTLIFVISFVAFVLVLFYLFTQQKNFLLGIFYKLPGISNLVKLIDITQFTRSMNLLLSSGIPIVSALDLTLDSVSRKETKEIIEQSKQLILSGKTFSSGLRTGKGYIPIMMIKLVETGERTGTIDKSMKDISEYYDYRVTNTLKSLTALIEPITLVLVGVVVGGMMISIIAPIYSLIGQISPH